MIRKRTVKRRKKKSRIKRGIYKGMKLDSSWELSYVLYCHDHKIGIQRNLKKFPYIYRGKIFNYIPDFIVEGKGYVEIKGRETKRDLAKYKHFPHHLTVLYKNDLKNVFTYVINKYGLNFYQLYE
jgi:hypothetical protein